LNLIIQNQAITTRRDIPIERISTKSHFIYTNELNIQSICMKAPSIQKIIARYQKNINTCLNHHFQKFCIAFIKELLTKLFIKSRDSIFFTKDSL
jgi:hypothetical protein